MHLRAVLFMGQKVTIMFSITLLLFILTINPIYAEQTYTPSTLVMTFFEDGVVQVEYEIKANITYPTIDIALFGEVYENIIIVNHDGIPLDYTLIAGGIVVDTLGSSAVKITYFTSDLTTKSGRIWTLTADTPTKARIILPSEATIISLSNIPTEIKSFDGQTLLTMPEGRLEVTYTLAVMVPATSPTPAPTPSSEFEAYWGVLTIAAIIIVVIIFAVFRFWRKPKPPAAVSEKRAIDVENIFRQKPQLRFEDREAVQFIAECGGEAFEKDIRNRLKLPRTTIWRMMQRLEREDIAEIHKIGGENLIRLKPKNQRETA